MIVGVEIGGTKLQFAVAAPTAPEKLVDRIRWPVDRAAGAEGILRQIEAGIERLRAQYPLTRIGIGYGGPVDSQRGRTITSHQVTGWNDFPLVQWLVERWSILVSLGNDCNVAALAEATLGAGRGDGRVLFVTVGTGIGGGLVVDGRVDGQQRPAVAEVGHLRPGLECGAPDETVEARASGLGIERTAALALDDPAAWGVTAEVAAQLRRQWLDDGRSITVPNLAAAAAAGQPLAQRILDRATTVLGWALAQATTLMSPECIVVGGGVSLIGPSYLAAVERAWRTYVFPPLQDACRIVPVALGEDVVLYGAILLACGDGPAT